MGMNPASSRLASRHFAHASIRPLVRYVDADQAVIDIHFTLTPPSGALALPRTRLETDIEMTGAGERYTHHTRVDLQGSVGLSRFTINHPQRWWPAGLGDQVLYDLKVSLVVGDTTVETWSGSIGLTSVRTIDDQQRRELTVLLVNGREWSVRELVAVKPDDETEVIPVGTDTLLVVSDHFGPDELYAAADRAGLLLIQSVPATEDGPATAAYLAATVDRLSAHPCLAGWHINAQRPQSMELHRRLHELDPTRRVFHSLPLAG